MNRAYYWSGFWWTFLLCPVVSLYALYHFERFKDLNDRERWSFLQGVSVAMIWDAILLLIAALAAGYLGTSCTSNYCSSFSTARTILQDIFFIVMIVALILGRYARQKIAQNPGNGGDQDPAAVVVVETNYSQPIYSTFNQQQQPQQGNSYQSQPSYQQQPSAPYNPNPYLGEAPLQETPPPPYTAFQSSSLAVPL